MGWVQRRRPQKRIEILKYGHRELGAAESQPKEHLNHEEHEEHEEIKAAGLPIDADKVI